MCLLGVLARWWMIDVDHLLPGTCPRPFPYNLVEFQAESLEYLLTEAGNLEGPEIEKFLNPISLPKRGMRGTRPRILDERELG